MTVKENVAQTAKFEYLGSIIRSNEDIDEDNAPNSSWMVK